MSAEIVSKIRGFIQKFPDWVIMKYTFTTINTRWEATQRFMAAKLTRLTYKIAIQLHLLAESCTICSSHSRRPVRKLFDKPSCIKKIPSLRLPEEKVTSEVDTRSWQGYKYVWVIQSPSRAISASSIVTNCMTPWCAAVERHYTTSTNGIKMGTERQLKWPDALKSFEVFRYAYREGINKTGIFIASTKTSF
jgi:hypothetical protein